MKSHTETAAALGRKAKSSLQRHGKTFWFASLFLPKRMASDAAMLYAFCRNLDDLADASIASGSTQQDIRHLQQIRSDLNAGVSHDPLLTEILLLASGRGLDLRAAACLLETLLVDATGGAQITEEAGLIRYCYGAAGTVGLMMCAILGVETPEARLQAIDLGIAMQLTNIARDVAQDALLDRRYVPASWVRGVTPAELRGVQGEDLAMQAILAAGIERVLALADLFYASAVPGFAAIPPRARKGIRIAAAIYREIGVILRKRGCVYSQRRVVVPFSSKLGIALSVYFGRSSLEKLNAPREGDSSHEALAGLPGLL